MKSKATIRFIEFIRPDSYWPYPYSLEQAFSVFQWMLKTGEDYQDHGRWGSQNIKSLLSCKPTCTNFSEVDPIRSVDDLQRRFHFAILSNSCGQRLKEWRETFRVTHDGCRTIHFPHHDYGTAVGFNCETQFNDGINSFLQAKGQLNVQLNEYHERAVYIHRVDLHCRGYYRFVLKYGYHNDSSEWSHLLAKQTPHEAFGTTFARAKKKLDELMSKPTISKKVT